MLTEEQIRNIPQRLKEFDQWVAWKLVPKENGKSDKIPIDPATGKYGSATDPSIYRPFNEALKISEKYSGVGFCFTKEDPFSGVDLDDCVKEGNLLEKLKRIILKLNSYSEISPSRKGVKIFLEGDLPGPNKNTPLVEMYSASRFFTVTGNVLNGNSAAVEKRQKELEEIYFQFFPEEIPIFGSLFRDCYLMRFLKGKADSGISLSHNTRIAIGSFSIALGELETEEMPFITVMLGGCPDYSFEKTRKQVESLVKKENQAPWGCTALKKQVEGEFSEFDPSKCDCNLQSKEGRKPSPIRLIEPAIKSSEDLWFDEEEHDFEVPSVLPFPLDVFPARYQKVISEISEAFIVPIEIPGCILLSLAGACLGRTRAIRVSSTWVQHGNLWIAIVGRSGIGKTHPLMFIQRPVFDLEKEWSNKYEKAFKEYEQEMVDRKKLSKEERALLGPDPSPPIWQQLIVDDATEEAVSVALKDNPRGILWSRDELSGMILDLNKHTGREGGTKARLMSAYDSGPWKVSRSSKRSFFIPHACLSIFGGIQPKYLNHIFSELDADIGFLPRFLFVLTERNRPAIYTGKEVSDQSTRDLKELVDNLLSLETDGQDQSILIDMEPAARKTYLDWHTAQAKEPFRIFNAEEYEPVIRKLQGQCLRIALILHYMDNQSDRPISEDTVKRAIQMISFFKSHQVRIWSHMINQKELLNLPVLARRVLQAIVSLEDQIKGDMLPTIAITKCLNQEVDEEDQVSPGAVGKCARHLKLGTNHLPDKSRRGFIITQKDLKRLKHLRDTSDASDTSFNNEFQNKSNPESGTISQLSVQSVPSVPSAASIQSENENSPKKSVPSVQCVPNVSRVELVQSPEALNSIPDFIHQNEINRVFVDTETAGLDPLNDQLVLIQIMAGDRVCVIDVEKLGSDLSVIKDLMEDKNVLKVFHNAVFDVKFLKKHIGCDTRNIFDTFLAERLLTAGIVPLNKLGLKDLTNKYLDMELDKSLRTTFKPGEELSVEQIEYAVMDVKVLKPIFDAQKKKLKDQGLVNTALLEFSIVPAVADIELKGMLLDQNKLEELKKKLIEKQTRLEEELQSLVKGIQIENQKKLFDISSINFRSTQQVTKILSQFGYQVESTDNGHLKKIDHPFAKTLIEHRKTSKLLSSFVLKLPKHINHDTGRIHPEFPQLGTDTGRFSCQRPNLQQIPKEQEWRDLFIAPQGYKLLTADYSQIELRILAEFSQDAVFLEAYRNGEDLHRKTAGQIGVSRDVAKTINFGLCYGMGSNGLADRLGIDVKQSQEFIQAYFKAYPQVKRTLDELGIKAITKGFSETPLARKRYFKQADSMSIQKSLERRGRNTPIQATCGDILKRAVLYLSEDLKGLDAQIVNLVHDEIVLEFREDGTELVTKIVEDCMVRAGKGFLKSVPVEIDIVVDDRWKK